MTVDNFWINHIGVDRNNMDNKWTGAGVTFQKLRDLLGDENFLIACNKKLPEEIFLRIARAALPGEASQEPRVDATGSEPEASPEDSDADFYFWTSVFEIIEKERQDADNTADGDAGSENHRLLPGEEKARKDAQDAVRAAKRGLDMAQEELTRAQEELRRVEEIFETNHLLSESARPSTPDQQSSHDERTAEVGRRHDTPEPESAEQGHGDLDVQPEKLLERLHLT